MNDKTPLGNLQDDIKLLKSKQAYEFEYMKEQFLITKESLKPGNLIADTFKTVNTPDTRSVITKGVLGLITGFVTKKFLFGGATSPVKKVIGTLLQFGVSSVVYKNTNALQAYGSTILNTLFSKRKAASATISEPESIR